MRLTAALLRSATTLDTQVNIAPLDVLAYITTHLYGLLIFQIPRPEASLLIQHLLRRRARFVELGKADNRQETIGVRVVLMLNTVTVKNSLRDMTFENTTTYISVAAIIQ